MIRNIILTFIWLFAFIVLGSIAWAADHWGHGLTITDCYQQTVKWFILIDIIENGNLDISDPQVKPYINNLCLLLKNETGDFDLNNTLPNQTLQNYYQSNPPPDVLRDILKP